MIEFIYDDGGRAAAGFKGTTGDCVSRAIAIVTQKPYKEVYDTLNELAMPFNNRKHKRTVRLLTPDSYITVIKKDKRKSNSRTGVFKKVYNKYLLSIGMKWVPTMFIGKGCKVHLKADELPAGRLIVRLSKHLTAVIDGIVHDIYNPAREGHCVRPNDGGPLKHGEWLHPDGDVICSIQERCVYGYYTY